MIHKKTLHLTGTTSKHLLPSKMCIIVVNKGAPEKEVFGVLKTEFDEKK